MTPEELNELIKGVSSAVTLCHKEVLSFEEALRYTGMKKGALYKLTSERMIAHSKPNGKMIYFRRSDLDEWMMSNPMATETDLNTAALTYCMTHPRPRGRKIQANP